MRQHLRIGFDVCIVHIVCSDMLSSIACAFLCNFQLSMSVQMKWTIYRAAQFAMQHCHMRMQATAPLQSRSSCLVATRIIYPASSDGSVSRHPAVKHRVQCAVSAYSKHCKRHAMRLPVGDSIVHLP